MIYTHRRFGKFVRLVLSHVESLRRMSSDFSPFRTSGAIPPLTRDSGTHFGYQWCRQGVRQTLICQWIPRVFSGVCTRVASSNHSHHGPFISVREPFSSHGRRFVPFSISLNHAFDRSFRTAHPESTTQRTASYPILIGGADSLPRIHAAIPGLPETHF